MISSNSEFVSNEQILPTVQPNQVDVLEVQPRRKRSKTSSDVVKMIEASNRMAQVEEKKAQAAAQRNILDGLIALQKYFPQQAAEDHVYSNLSTLVGQMCSTTGASALLFPNTTASQAVPAVTSFVTEENQES